MLKANIHYFLNTNKAFLKFIYTLIILNVVSIVIASYSEIRNDYTEYLNYFEYFSVFVFTIEYFLRIWSADIQYENSKSKFKKLKFITSKYGLVDLFAILPFFLPLIFPFDARVIRILRLFRLLRIFKLGRLSKSMKTINGVLKETREELLVTIFVAFVFLILSSTLMYYIENEAQPEKFGDIGQSMWWAVATLTTVGYGDVYPITGTGKFLSAVIALIGIGFVALPTGIISSAFIAKVQKKKENKRLENQSCECPNCGHKISL